MRQFYGHLEKCVLSAGKTMSVKFPFFWGGVWGGGGSADFIFMGARIFLNKARHDTTLRVVNSLRVTVTEIFVAAKEEQQQALHYSNSFPKNVMLQSFLS